MSLKGHNFSFLFFCDCHVVSCLGFAKLYLSPWMVSCQPWRSPILPYFKFQKILISNLASKAHFRPPQKIYFKAPKTLFKMQKNLISHLLKPYFRIPKSPTSNPHKTLFQPRKTLFQVLNSYFSPQKNLISSPKKSFFQSPTKPSFKAPKNL